ncbi:MAG: TIGR04211 family SH3 domain-containing protein [Pseudomonadales bacterium]|jgi:SH3 domain protein|tara:strand:- start:1759 stop:2436 length:678 start_codon:yes stop_codon:yes gene_type:complete
MKPLLGLMCLVFSAASVAETLYIRDTLYLPLRAEPIDDSELIRKGLKSGTPLESLGALTDNGYRWVRFEEDNGNLVEGYIQDQYLVNQPIARTQLETLTASLEAATQEANMAGAALNEAIAVRNNALNDAETSREQLRLANDEIARITALSVDAISLAAALDDAQQRARQQTTELAMLQTQQATLSQKVEQRWFLIGGGIVFSGALIGFWVSRRIYHRGFSGGWG